MTFNVKKDSATEAARAIKETGMWPRSISTFWWPPTFTIRIQRNANVWDVLPDYPYMFSDHHVQPIQPTSREHKAKRTVASEFANLVIICQFSILRFRKTSLYTVHYMNVWILSTLNNSFLELNFLIVISDVFFPKMSKIFWFCGFGFLIALIENFGLDCFSGLIVHGIFLCELVRWCRQCNSDGLTSEQRLPND